MNRLAYLMLLSVGCMSLCFADDGCCGDDDSEGSEEPQQRRAHVRLFYSGQPEEKVQDPREDYEWPGMNEDTFYDYFTK